MGERGEGAGSGRSLYVKGRVESCRCGREAVDMVRLIEDGQLGLGRGLDVEVRYVEVMRP